MAVPRQITLVAHQFRYDLLAFARNGQARFFTLALPVAFLLIFATVFRSKTVPVPGGLIHTSVYYVPGIIALGVITLPLYFISGVFLATTLLPHWLLQVAGLFPVRHFQQALLAAYSPYSSGSGFVGRDLVIMAAWAVAGLLVAILRFRWTPQSR